MPFATVCFRHLPASARELPAAERQTEIDRVNEAILARVNRDGRIFLSHTRLGGRFTLRASIGNPRADERHGDGVGRCCAARPRGWPPRRRWGRRSPAEGATHDRAGRGSCTTTASAGAPSTSSSSCSSATTGRSCVSSSPAAGSLNFVPPTPHFDGDGRADGNPRHDRVPRLGGDRGPLRGGDRGTPLPGSGALHGRGAPPLRTPRGALGCAARDAPPPGSPPGVARRIRGCRRRAVARRDHGVRDDRAGP